MKSKKVESLISWLSTVCSDQNIKPNPNIVDFTDGALIAKLLKKMYYSYTEILLHSRLKELT